MHRTRIKRKSEFRYKKKDRIVAWIPFNDGKREREVKITKDRNEITILV